MTIRTLLDENTYAFADDRLAPVRTFRLENSNGFAITLSDFGAAVLDVSVPCRRTGKSRCVTLSLPRLEDYQHDARNPYMLGATMGRFSRSISGAAFILEGQSYTLDANQGPHHFHGGFDAFHKRSWTPSIRKVAGTPIVEMALMSPDGDQGYPGTVNVKAVFTLLGNGFQVEYFANTNAPTIFGLCNHIFWDLTGTGAGLNQNLIINAKTMLLNDSLGIPLGDPRPVDGSPFDFRNQKSVSSASLDNCFPLDGGNPACVLSDPDSGLELIIETNKPIAAVFATAVDSIKSEGVCLQLTDWPDAPNRSDFPSAALYPGQIDYNYVRYTFNA